MRQIQVGEHSETVVDRSDFPPERIQSILGHETIAVLGYGSQGRGQSLNLRDNGLKVIVGLREGGPGWRMAVEDGWQPGTTLLPIADAATQGSIIFYLLSDAGQKEFWPTLKPLLTPGKALVFAHGFSIVYADQTGVVPPQDIDVLLVAPKGSGTTLRRHFTDGLWVNSSYCVRHDATGRGRDRALALGIAIGSGHLFETTFERETNSDLFGERGSLLGAIYGLWLAQYEVLRANGYSPTEAFNETVEEATQSLYPLIGEKGMDWMYANCSTTAQRGALDWFEKFRDATKPVFEQLFKSVISGDETRRTLEANSRANYRQELEKELKAVADSEMWQAGKVIRELRPMQQTPNVGTVNRNLDADDQALQRIADDGADLSRPMVIDFQVAIQTEGGAREFGVVAEKLGYRVKIYRSPECAQPWTCECSTRMLATHNGVVAVQNELAMVSAKYGGFTDGWGTFGNQVNE